MGVVGRAADRKDYSTEYHFIAVDDDLDRVEQTLREIKDGVRSLQRIGLGLLVSITTAAIMLALNLTGLR